MATITIYKGTLAEQFRSTNFKWIDIVTYPTLKGYYVVFKVEGRQESIAFSSLKGAEEFRSDLVDAVTHDVPSIFIPAEYPRKFPAQ